ncbi:low temperature requirement protein LtrA [Krasilnikovia cinnamomea]|uniref:Low temperature requirement protein LtrA n=2 Tax=Krasilnikovia cinnamomea TaxID=349313 RepID=A0A4Q7ZKD1_9ACTN|nr:low temperature requirement protein LtrA [Krasilnikovia cinnamomea]
MVGMAEPETNLTEPRRPVSSFELFFDLVFVFSLTRVTDLILRDPHADGVLRGMLVLALLWWAWGAYAWLTNAVDTNSASARGVVLSAMGALLVVAVAVPEAFGENALPFALAYFVVRVLHLVLFAVAGGANRAAILRLAPGNLAASILLIIGVFVPSTVQLILWGLAVLIDYGTPIITGVGGFTVHAGHFFERHGLFMIIALGESVVAVGAGVLLTGAHITPLLAATILLSVAAIGGLWWAYFDWEAALSERQLSRAIGAERAHLARDMFSYLHLPLVAGVVFIAVGLESVVSHPTHHMHGVHAIGLGGGAALFMFGLSAISGRRGHRPRLDHLVAGLFCLLLIPVSLLVPGVVALVLLVGVLLVIAYIDRHHGRTGYEPRARAAQAVSADA